MKKIALICILALAFNTTAMAVDIALSTQTSWWPEATATTEMQDIADSITDPDTDVQIFSSADEAALANWVAAHTGDGRADLLVLCGRFPNSIYGGGNAEPDGSLAELFLDDGNTIINTGDWIFYVGSVSNNAAAGLQNMMDIAAVTTAGGDNTPVTVTAEGQEITPSLYDIATDRPFHLDTLESPWYSELILAQNADGTLADPVIVRNAETGGRVGIFFQIADTDTDMRGEVIGEWINNWYLPLTALEAQRSSKPSPVDGATDTLRDIVLSWTPGESATTHDVYFGTSFDDVNDATTGNPLDVLLSEGQAATTVDLPERLEFGTTYYWRVDEVGATVVKGAVWSFTTELFAYPIENVTVTSNATSNENQGPENVVDGSGLNADDQHSMDTSTMWGGTPNPTEPTYLLFEFDGVYKLNELLVWNYNMEFETFLGLGVKSATLEYSEDGQTWSVLGDVELAQATSTDTYTANTTIPFDGVAAQAVRMTVNSNFAGSTQLYGLSEVRFTYIPILPSQPGPADGAADVAVDAMLSWQTGREAASHEVYFGTDPAALDMVGTTTQSSYSPTLNLGTEYSWQIVEVNEAETPASWAGPVWTFSTQEDLVVDDFESYIDDETAGDVIWEIWIDGLVAFGGDAANGGSQVGHNTSPFAEQTIVRSGQSMPLYYDNPTASDISEADRTLSPAQDWTAYGVKSLSLWFSGTTGNTGTLYVKINDTKVSYDGSATDIGTPGWQKWNIALAETGANLSNVSSLSVGVEGAGSGLVYIDDIHLSATVATPRTSDISIAISTQANWWSQAAADREMEEIVDKAQAPVVVFGTGNQDGLAEWVSAHTNNGVANLLILCGQLPDTIYEPGNVQADDSLVEQFLDAGNTVINTGDWIFYVVNTAGTNGEAGLQTIMDIPGVTVAGGDDTPVTVTAEGQAITPSLQDFATDRPFHLDTLEGDWSTELVLAQNADGLLADPVIVRNSVTGGRIGVFHQASGEDDLPRGEVMSEWINNWYLDAASGN